MKYVMLICDEPSLYKDLTAAEREAGYAEIYAHIEKWGKLGRYVEGGAELQGPQTGRTIRGNGSGGVVVTDGPYAELKELIGGFMMIEADSIEEAVETASEWPGIKYGSAVEVRPVVVRDR
jgi:hypothetical protein